MNQLRSDVQVPVSAPMTRYPASATAGRSRLVVVIRDVQEEALLAGRIQEQARARGLPVFLLGIAREPAMEAQVRRSLVTIAAFLQEGNRHAGQLEIQVECGRDWLNHISALVRPGDLVACYADGSSVFGRSLSDTLSRALNVPIYTFQGPGAERTPHNTLAQLASWVGSLACIGGFLLLQARIVLAFQGTLQSVLMLLALGAEVGSIWLVNSLSGQL